MNKLTATILSITTITATFLFTSCDSSSSGDNETIDNTHMFGTFRGTMITTDKDTTETKTNRFYMIVGEDSDRIDEENYIYLTVDSDEAYYSGQVNINRYVTKYVYNADTTVDTITWSKEITEGEDSFDIQGTMIFNSDFDTGSSNGSITSNNNYSVDFQCTDFSRQ
ncbi:MAG: hypothetical protein PF692_04675 [Kiritimatiellae bacterium]|jgi:hypothetical protein|nr:hypothetical protein [Kiritimatiellia bacterium]